MRCLGLALLAPLAAALQIPLLSPAADDRGRTIAVASRHEVVHSTGPLYGASAHRRVPPSPSAPTFTLRSQRRRLLRPRARAGTAAYQAARRGVMRDRRGQAHPADYEPMGWDEIEVEAPDVGDLETLASLAGMSGNAYWSADEAEDNRWYDIGGHFNLSSSFGWASSGLRGHVFATPDNATVRVVGSSRR